MSTAAGPELTEALQLARRCVATGEDEAAKSAYLDVLRRDPTHLAALNELGNLALAGGFRSAARTAYTQAVQHHPSDKVSRVNLANLLYAQEDAVGARRQYEAALAIDPHFAAAHQGMARILSDAGQEAAADAHWHRGFEGHATVTKPYRGRGVGIPLLMLVSTRGGNIPSELWITPKHFEVSAIYPEFYDTATPLPPHVLVVNVIGDADACEPALGRAQDLVAHTHAPVINAPARVRLTGRAENARRLRHIPGLIAPLIETVASRMLRERPDLRYPLLLRRAGFHTGRHFSHVEDHQRLMQSVDELAADELLLIQYLDARGPDGMARKYRVMFVDGDLYPLHLAISSHWKVHYFSADMAQNARFRQEEERFLNDMPAVLGTKAMRALRDVCMTLGLEYAGIDFALSADGSVLLFEANATMVVFPPNPDPIWDYRRQAIDTVINAATNMLLRRARVESNS